MLTVDFMKHLNCGILSTVLQEENETQWLANRSRGIGGSDLGTIMGVNPFSNARLLYLAKLGMYEDPPEKKAEHSERMHFGRMLEPIVAAEFEIRNDRRVAVSPATYMHLDFTWMLANIDRFVIDDKGVPYAILECKTSSEYMNYEWVEGDVPISYIYQCQWYMFVTGLRMCWLAVLVGGNKYYQYEIPYDETLVTNVLIPAASNFWFNCVGKLVEPQIDGSESATAYLKAKYNCVPGSEMTFTDEVINELANTIVDTKAKIKELEGIVSTCQNRIKDQMKEAEIAYTIDRVVKWSPRLQRRVNTDLLKTSYPDIYQACLKEINYRVFMVK